MTLGFYRIYMDQSPGEIPSTNLNTYILLYKIEVGLRELIIQSLHSIDQKWLKHRLSGELIAKYKDGKLSERMNKWTELIPHHPLYYLDFPDLKQIIERSDNWKDVFQDYFADKQVFIGMLRALEPIRNKVAHNRKISASEEGIVKATYYAFNNAIGMEKYQKLITNQTILLDIPDRLIKLQNLSNKCYQEIKKYSILTSIDFWLETKFSWWFDSDYLGHDINPITDYFDLLEEYNTLPRYRGSGIIIEGWVRNHNLDEKFHEVIQFFLEFT
jgi:hypothetical protein